MSVANRLCVDAECTSEYTDSNKIYLENGSVVVNLTESFPQQNLYFVMEFNGKRWSLAIQIEVCGVSLRDSEFTLGFELNYLT